MERRAGRAAGRAHAGTGGAATAGTPLPLEAEVESTPVGWTVRLPVRLEAVDVEKRTVVRERVRVLRREQTETQRIEETVRSERLRTEVVETGEGRHHLETRTYTGEPAAEYSPSQDVPPAGA